MLKYVLKDQKGVNMAKWCFNYESGEYEYIERDGFSIDQGEYVYNWDDSEYREEDGEEKQAQYLD